MSLAFVLTGHPGYQQARMATCFPDIPHARAGSLASAGQLTLEGSRPLRFIPATPAQAIQAPAPDRPVKGDGFKSVPVISSRGRTSSPSPFCTGHPGYPCHS